MKRLLMIQPLRIYKRWPMPDDFTGLVLGSPTLAFAQIASILPEYEITYMDGAVENFTLKKFTNEIHKADVVLVNAHSSIGALNTEHNIRHILEIDGNKPIILGGHHATVYDFEWLGRGVHFIVRNEGEETVKELLDAIKTNKSYSNIKGLSWRDDNNNFHRNPDRKLITNLDDLPMPDWSIYNKKLYHLPFSGKGMATTAETSRGCHHQCTFCAASKMWFHKQRFKSPERVLDELHTLKSMGFSKLWFADDNFQADPNRYRAIYEGMIREKLGFNFMVFIRSDTIANNPELITLAQRAGLRACLVGFESPVNQVLADNNKSNQYENIIKTAEILKRNEIFLGAFYIVGYLNEKQEHTDQTFKAAEEYSDYPIISIFEPRKGTKDFTRSHALDELPGGDMFYHNTVKFIQSKTHILQQYRKFYRSYLLKPKQWHKLLFGTDTQRHWYRNLYGNMLKSILSVSPSKISHPWMMVRDIWK